MPFSSRKTFLTLTVVIVAASGASAIQTQVMIQGYLTNASGTPYTTAQATEFRVYQGGNAMTAGSGTLYYDETASITPSASGVFNYPLGSGTPTVAFLVVGAGGTIANVLSTTTFDTTSAVYLEISVGGIAVLPRLQMLGTPYAALAGTSENLKPTSQPLITANYLQASSGTFTAAGSNQASIVTSSGIIVSAGGVTAPFFNGTLYGNVAGTAGNVAAGSVTPGTFGAGVLVPPANIVGGIASTNTVNTFPLAQNFIGGVFGSSASFTNGISASAGTFTTSGPNQASIVTSSGIIVSAGGVTAPFFNGTLYGNVAGTAGNVAAGSVTPGTFGPGVLIPPANIVGGIASTNTVNYFPLVQLFRGGVIASSGTFFGGVTAASGTFTASGSTQASIVTSSGIIVSAGGVTAPYFSGTLYGSVSGGAGSVAAGNVTPGTFGGGVLVPPANVIGGIASTNTANTFPLAQTFAGGVLGSSAGFTDGIIAASATLTASGSSQYSLAAASGIIVAAGGVTAPYFSGTLYGNVNGSAGSVAAAGVTTGTLGGGVLVPPANIVGGVASTNTVNYFPLVQLFRGGIVASSGTFFGGVTASSGTFTASGSTQASIVTSSGIIVSAGGVTAPYFSGTLYGNVAGTAGNVAAGSVTPGSFGSGVLVPPENIVGGVASTNTANTFPLVQTFPGGVSGSSGSFTNGITAASATLTASGSSQYSLSTASGIVVSGGGVTAPFFSGTLYGNVSGSAGGVAAAGVTTGTFGGGVLVPPANVIGGVASTNTANTFPLAQSFPGGVTASSATLTANGSSQYSLATASGIVVSAGGVTAPFFSGTLYGNVVGTAGNVAAGSITPGTFGPGVLLPPANIVGGVASTNTANVFTAPQTVQAELDVAPPGADALEKIGAVYSGPTSGYSSNGQVTSVHTLAFRSWSNAFNDTLGVKLLAINKTAYGSSPWYFSQLAELHIALLTGGALTGDDTVDLFQFKSDGFHVSGGVVGSSASFTNGLTASSGTFTAGGDNQASIVTSSGIIVNGGGVTAPYFAGTLYGNVSGSAGGVSAGGVTPGTFGGGVLVPPANIVGGVASTNTANTFPLAQTFQGGVVSSFESVANGVTAASGTFTASGANQASIVTSSGIIVSAGGVTAPYFNGTLIGSVSGGAGSVAAGSVTPGVFVGGVLVPPQNVIGGVASTNTANTFPLVQTFQGGVVSSVESIANGVTAASGTFTASGNNQASIATSSGIVVSGGGVTAPYVSATNLYGNGAGVSNVTAAAVSGANVTGSVALLNGGTGATTAAGAQANLGVPSTTGSGASGTWGISITGLAPGMTPIGGGTLWFGTTEPVGWIECNGRSIPQTGTASASWGSYNTAALFAALGTVWGSAGGGYFNAPDLRGIFPRGWNHGKSSGFFDADAGSRISQYASGATGDAIGSYEMDQFRSHTHGLTMENATANLGGGGGIQQTTGSPANVTAAAGGNETRPMNASVMYIIRVQ